MEDLEEGLVKRRRVYEYEGSSFEEQRLVRYYDRRSVSGMPVWTRKWDEEGIRQRKQEMEQEADAKRKVERRKEFQGWSRGEGNG